MTEKECLQAILDDRMPSHIPHFELVFQLEEEAFGIRYMTQDEYTSATPAERQKDDMLRIEVSARLVEDYGWAALQGDTKRLKQELGDKALIYDFNGQGTFWLMPGDDMMQFAIDMYENSTELHKRARMKCDESIELAKRQRDAGVDFLCINSDYGFNSGPFISPKHFTEFVTPYLTEIVEAIHGMGLKAILHSDGNLNAILGQLIGAGLDGYQSVDPQGGMDIATVRADYPELILMGNVQCSLLQDTDEEMIRANARHAIKYGYVGGRYIFSTSNCIFKGMPLESYLVMLDEYRRWRHCPQALLSVD